MSFFDPVSFAIGAGAGLGVGSGYFLLKDRLGGSGSSEDEDTPEGIGGAREFISPQSGTRYERDLRDFLRFRHLAGTRLALRDVLVEPRFLRGRPANTELRQDEEGVLIETDIYRVIPMTHQFPAIYASFNMDTIGLQDIGTGNRHVAILGVPGSGKSTALATLGLIALGDIDPVEDFKSELASPIPDDEMDVDESEEVRERRRKEREEVQKRAVNELRLVQERSDDDEEGVSEEGPAALNLAQYMPMYVHIRDVDLNPSDYGGKIDPAEPIVRALRKYVSKLTADLSPPLLYRALRNGKGLVLIDGYDELTPEERDLYAGWLGAFLQYYDGNMVVITGPATGYDPLAALGFATTFIRPFNERHYDELLNKMLAAWGGNEGEEEDEDAREADRAQLWVDMRNRNLLDVWIKTWAVLNEDIREPGRRGYYEQYVRHALEGLPEEAIGVVEDIAATWLDTGVAPGRDVLREIANHHLGLDEPVQEEEAEEDGKESKKAKKAPTSEADKLLNQLSATPLIHEQPDGAFAFSHPVVGWYLASERLRHGASPELLTELGDKPNWHGALTFATAFVDLEPTVLRKVTSKSDLLYSNLFSVVDWMPDAPANLRWTGEVLKRLGAALLANTQFPTVREHVVAAMVASRDASGGVPYMLRQAVRSGNANVRMLGCIGLGALNVDKGIADLTPMLVDEISEVQLAAGLALGAIGSEPALRSVIEALLTGDPTLRKAVAEALSSIPGEGHAILMDGIDHEDIEVRRACCYGLARIPATWALAALYRAMLEDSQWYVRQAAESAFKHAREPRVTGPVSYPEPVEYEWLASWVGQRGESVPEGPGGRPLLMRALQEAPEVVRTEAAVALGRLGHVQAMKALYSALGDGEASVRAAAFDALGHMSDRFGKPLPGLA